VIVATQFDSFLTPDMASFFDAFSGVKKIPDLYPAINYTNLAFEPSIAELAATSYYMLDWQFLKLLFF